MNNKYKKLIKYLSGIVIVIIIFFSGIKINNWIEWEMAVDAAGTMPVQLGITKAKVIKCFPSCQTPAGVATCCAPQTGNCLLFVPGINGTYDTGCMLFSEVSGVQAGGMGNNALLSNMAIGQAALTSGGQLIYGGTINNMSMMALGAPNMVLASAGGCFGCVAKVGLINNIKEKFKFIITSFKN